MSAPKTGGPVVDPLHSPETEDEAFLVDLSMAYSDFDEFLATWKPLPHRPYAQVCMPRHNIPYATVGLDV